MSCVYPKTEEETFYNHSSHFEKRMAEIDYSLSFIEANAAYQLHRRFIEFQHPDRWCIVKMPKGDKQYRLDHIDAYQQFDVLTLRARIVLKNKLLSLLEQKNLNLKLQIVHAQNKLVAVNMLLESAVL